LHTTVLNGPQGFGIYLTYDTVVPSAVQPGLLPTVQQVLPPEVLQQTPLQLQYLDTNTYLVSHPSLFWPVEQAPTAQAVVQQLANKTRGWRTTVANGPQGYGLYATYRPAASPGAPSGLRFALVQLHPPTNLHQPHRVL